MYKNRKTGLSSCLILFAASACSPGGGRDTGAQTTDRTPPAATDAVAEATPLERTPSPEGASVEFLMPQDGAVVSSPVRVEFRISGMELAPAGTRAENAGHHHIVIDTELPALSMPVPTDANHVHFGDGSTATELTLPAGEHTLQLLFADYLHIPHDAPVYSEPITITVE